MTNTSVYSTYGIEWLEGPVTKQTDPNNQFMSNVISNIRFQTNAGESIPDWVLLRAYYDGGGIEAENDGHDAFVKWMTDLYKEYCDARDLHEMVEDAAENAPFMGPWMVSFCKAQQSYGGPEEGGWYYTTYDPNDGDVWLLNKEHDALRVFWEHDKAVAFMQSLLPICEQVNKGRRPIYSVLSDGVFDVRVYEGWPSFEPKVRPHYE